MRPRPRANAAAQAKRTGKSRFGSVGNSPLRSLYHPDAEAYTSPVEELVIPLAERKTIQTLTECSCRWPIGDPQLADFHFCGKDKVMGLPYCDFHARRAFQPPQPRRRDREREHTIVQAPALAAPEKTETLDA